MDAPGPERRLAAAVAADMVGYSRLMEVDETGTLARLQTHRIELIGPAVAKNRGRIIKTTGDGGVQERAALLLHESGSGTSRTCQSTLAMSVNAYSVNVQSIKN